MNRFIGNPVLLVQMQDIHRKEEHARVSISSIMYELTLSERDSTFPRSSMRSRCDVRNCCINSSSLLLVPAPSGCQLASLSWASRPERWTSLFANSVCSRWFWSVRCWFIRRSSTSVCCDASRRSVTTLRSFSLLVSDFWSCIWKIKWKVRTTGYVILFNWRNVH